ncbi:hypothetical protein JR316_0002402 [Psilocybe cubensis]|uniref:Uncharacterized protein n=2 Tax=Psilocybe cubensis TaxID=181762 RepID=A0A8H7Y7W7_PSICU|nr:hypothetical protein JR316_0002402 [Psilocybe cubensis]KAH9485494.1 hypothetical protein JR316_0002402 [Psilocybe cubensis]
MLYEQVHRVTSDKSDKRLLLGELSRTIDPNTITSPSVLAVPTNEDAILTQISILTGKIKSIDLDASSIAESLDHIQDTKIVVSSPRRDHMSDLPGTEDLKGSIWSKVSKMLRIQLASLDFGLIGKQVEDLVERLITVRERLHIDLLSRRKCVHIIARATGYPEIIPGEATS